VALWRSEAARQAAALGGLAARIVSRGAVQNFRNTNFKLLRHAAARARGQAGRLPTGARERGRASRSCAASKRRGTQCAHMRRPEAPRRAGPVDSARGAPLVPGAHSPQRTRHGGPKRRTGHHDQQAGAWVGSASQRRRELPIALRSPARSNPLRSCPLRSAGPPRQGDAPLCQVPGCQRGPRGGTKANPVGPAGCTEERGRRNMGREKKVAAVGSTVARGSSTRPVPPAAPGGAQAAAP